MRRKVKGQEATEFVIISILVFIATLVAALVFSDQIAAFFNNAPTGTDKKVAEVGEEYLTTGFIEPHSTGGVNEDPTSPENLVNIPIGGGEYAEILFPDPDDYIETAGSGGNTVITNGQYSTVLGQIFQELAEETNNSNLLALAQVIQDMGGLESILPPTYDSDFNPEWQDNIPLVDPYEYISEVVGSLETTLDQLTQESLNPAAPNLLNEFTSIEQYNYDARLTEVLAQIQADSSLSNEVKQISNLLCEQVTAIADTTTYTVDSDAYDAAVSSLTILNTKLSSPLVFSPVTEVDKATYLVSLINTLEVEGLTSEINSLSTEDKTKLVDAYKTLKLDINTPEGSSVIMTDLVEQAKCISEPSTCP